MFAIEAAQFTLVLVWVDLSCLRVFFWFRVFGFVLICGCLFFRFGDLGIWVWFVLIWRFVLLWRVFGVAIRSEFAKVASFLGFDLLGCFWLLGWVLFFWFWCCDDFGSLVNLFLIWFVYFEYFCWIFGFGGSVLWELAFQILFVLGLWWWVLVIVLISFLWDWWFSSLTVLMIVCWLSVVVRLLAFVISGYLGLF